MATKEHKRQARGLVEALEVRVHAGPPVCETEIHSAREFLLQNDFSTSSDYFNRLGRIQERMLTRPPVASPPEKRNYGGEAGGSWMQVLSVYDHVILSICYEGDFNARHGRIKISHRFNQAGRIDFVEAKLLRSLQPGLTGAIRKLVTVRDYQHVQKDWHATGAFSLRVLPQELVLLFADIFRCPKQDMLAWLINIGHRAAADLLADLRSRTNGHSGAGLLANPNQLDLPLLLTDDVALPILEQAAALESSVELESPDSIVVRYVHNCN